MVIRDHLSLLDIFAQAGAGSLFSGRISGFGFGVGAAGFAFADGEFVGFAELVGATGFTLAVDGWAFVGAAGFAFAVAGAFVGVGVGASARGAVTTMSGSRAPAESEPAVSKGFAAGARMTGSLVACAPNDESPAMKPEFERAGAHAESASKAAIVVR